MIGIIYQIGGSRFGMSVLETLFSLLLLTIIVAYISGLMEEESQFPRKDMLFMTLRTILPTFFIVWSLRLVYDTFFEFLYLGDIIKYIPFSQALFIAIMATTFFPFFKLFSRKFEGFQNQGKNEERNQNINHLEKYKKVFKIVIILSWVISLIALSISLLNIPILYLYLGLFYALITILMLNGIVIIFNSALPVEKATRAPNLGKEQVNRMAIFLVLWIVDLILCFGFFLYGIITQIWYLWLFLFVGIFFAPKFMKRLGFIPQKIPEKPLKNSRAYASCVAFGVWIIQLLIFEVYWTILEELLGFSDLPQDLRLNIIVSYVVFICTFVIALGKKFQPLASAKKIATLKGALMYEEEEKQIGNVILEVKDLVTYFYTEEGIVRAVEGVSFQIFEGEVLGLVGETGCGKSVTALSIMQLVQFPGKIKEGQVIYRGEDLLQKTKDQMLNFRGNRITMCFQDPLNSINPVFKVGDQISEVFLMHQQPQLFKTVEEYSHKIKEQEKLIREKDNQIQFLTKKELVPTSDTKSKEIKKLNELIEIRKELEKEKYRLEKYASIYSVARIKVIDLIREVGIPDPEQIYDRYPYELSGGMRQRIGIAIAIACNPDILIADEPTTALDVTIQNQILKLFKDLRKKLKTSMLFITHDLGIIAKMCDRVAVMYTGYIVEYGDVIKLFEKPYHPYTRALISSIPTFKKKRRRLSIIPGMVPNLIYPPSGCRFHPRCSYCFEPCEKENPKSKEIEPNYYVACHLYDPDYKIEAEISIKKVENEIKK